MTYDNSPKGLDHLGDVYSDKRLLKIIDNLEAVPTTDLLGQKWLRERGITTDCLVWKSKKQRKNDDYIAVSFSRGGKSKYIYLHRLLYAKFSNDPDSENIKNYYIDHRCGAGSKCVNPDHLQKISLVENSQLVRKDQLDYLKLQQEEHWHKPKVSDDNISMINFADEPQKTALERLDNIPDDLDSVFTDL